MWKIANDMLGAVGQVSQLEVNKLVKAPMQSLVTVNENTAANPDGAVMENVPATVVGPVPGALPPSLLPPF
eukprot:269374-Rhodomonas_salina.1